jgi:DNA repair protein RadC
LVTTKKLEEVGDLMGIRLLDHLIIGDDQFISLKEQGFL